MRQTATTTPATLLEAIIDGLEQAIRHQPGVEEPPAAILWADPRGEWQPLIRLLRERLPQVLALGDYAPDQLQGPAIWLKCAMAGTLEEIKLPEDAIPIIYMPGVSRQSLRAGEECPRELQPLVELQFRGTVWTQKNGRDWTIEAMLTSDDGLGLDVARDGRTRQSLQAALPVLATTPVAHLSGKRLESEDFDKLMVGDHPRDLLMWMSDPETVHKRMVDEGSWHAFSNRCRDEYKLNPEDDGPLVGGEWLGMRSGTAWEQLWGRFCESPTLYPGLPDLLDQARPIDRISGPDAWPSVNREFESTLRGEMLELTNLDDASARKRVRELETEHGRRREWVWAKLGKCTLAFALEHLARLADATERAIGGDTPEDMAQIYVDGAFLADDAAMHALAAVTSKNDEQAVSAAVRTLYRNWAEDAARRLQQSITDHPLPGSEAQEKIEVATGGVLLFADGLRYDLGQRLQSSLEARGVRADLNHRWAALPTVTATAKPAVSPAADTVKGKELPASFAPQNDEGQELTTPRFRKMVEACGYQIIPSDETGEPATADARGWTECGQIDRRGHDLKARLAGQLADEVERLTERILELLEAGWKSVRVVTDHGWLLLPGGLPKHDLPKYLTECKWSRCATIKGQSEVKVPRAAWHWNRTEEFASAPGIACFRAGEEYAHGGISLQECLIPDITIEPRERTGGPAPSIVEAQWRGLRCRVAVKPPAPNLQVDIRTKPNDAKSSIALEVKELDASGKAGIVVENEDLEGTAAAVVLIDANGRLVAKHQTTVGGDD